MNFFTKSFLPKMLHENFIRRLQGFVILTVGWAKPLHCRNKDIVITAFHLKLLQILLQSIGRSGLVFLRFHDRPVLFEHLLVVVDLRRYTCV